MEAQQSSPDKPVVVVFPHPTPPHWSQPASQQTLLPSFSSPTRPLLQVVFDVATAWVQRHKYHKRDECDKKVSQPQTSQCNQKGHARGVVYASMLSAQACWANTAKRQSDNVPWYCALFFRGFLKSVTYAGRSTTRLRENPTQYIGTVLRFQRFEW